MQAARNICAVYGDNAIGESMARKWFSVLRRIVLTLVTPHVQCTRELANVMNCDVGEMTESLDNELCSGVCLFLELSSIQYQL